MKTGNGNEKAGITTFEFSAGRRQYCLIAIEYCVLTVLKRPNFFSSRRNGGGDTWLSGKCTNQQHMAQIWRFRLKIFLFRPAGAAGQLLVGFLSSWRKSGNSHLFPTLGFLGEYWLGFQKVCTREMSNTAHPPTTTSSVHPHPIAFLGPTSTGRKCL